MERKVIDVPLDDKLREQAQIRGRVGGVHDDGDDGEGDHDDAPRVLACATLDGRPIVVSGCGDGCLRVWDLARRETVREAIRIGADPIFALATATVDGRVVAVASGDGGQVHVVDVAAGASHVGPLVGHPLIVTDVVTARRAGRAIAFTRSAAELAYDGEGEYAYGGVVRGWDLAAGDAYGEVMTIQELGCLGGNDDVLLVGSHGSVRVWTPEGPGATCAIHDRLVMYTVVVRERERVLAVTADPYTVHVWDVATGELVGDALSRVEPSFDGGVAALVEVGGDVVIGRRGGDVEQWSIADRRVVREITGDPVTALAAGPDGSIVVARRTGAIEIVT